MAIKELFYDNRPQVLLDPRASQRIDPRFKFTRNGTAVYRAKDGLLRNAAVNEPRFDYNPATKEPLGLLLEKEGTNIFAQSEDFSNAYWVQSASTATSHGDSPFFGSNSYKIQLNPNPEQQFYRGFYKGLGITTPNYYTFSLFAKAGNVSTFSINESYSFGGGVDVNLSTQQVSPSLYVISAGIEEFPNGWYRIYGTWNLNGFTGNRYTVWDFRITPGLEGNYLYAFGAQLEAEFLPSSYIPTSGSAVTRPADLLSIEAPLPASGSVYIDARAISVAQNDTLLSLKNSSNDKIDLAYFSNTDTYNSLALIANYNDTSKTSLPLPVPTTDRERNIITWGAQNYQYGRDSSRFATSLSSSVPTALNQLSIGHDAVDPTKAFNGYINTVYAWSGELTPAVAAALVRNEIDAVNADTYSPTGPAGALALVINTQGASTSGDKTFTLPAESAADDNDIVITWGDDTESLLNGSSAELGASGLTHTYPAAGIYPVWVEGQMEGIRYNNIANAKDLLQIAAWGTGDMFTAPSTMNSAFYGCSQMDFSSSARAIANLPNTSAVTDWYRAFRDCSSITGIFPAFNFSAATTFQEAWQGCSSMTAFFDAGNQTQNVINFANAWSNCNSLTAFPEINTSSGENFSGAWQNCSTLTSFPPINTAAGKNFTAAWQNCSGLTAFPLINTAAGTNFTSTWQNCSSLDNIVNAAEATSFPAINTAAGTDFTAAWSGCSSFTNFPLITTSNGENFNSAWADCSSLASFPQLDTSEGTNFAEAWSGCSSLNNIGVVGGATTSFPSINTSKGTTFESAWRDCSSLTVFPSINTAAGENFAYTWLGCSGLTTFPSISTALGTTFYQAWRNCSSLTDFPANFFDAWTGTPSDSCFYLTWDGCSSLTPASVVNILNSIAASGQSAPSGTDTGNKEITIDWDGTGDPATDAAAAITTLKNSYGWDVVLNGVSQ